MSLRVAILCSAHGFGHLTRQLAIAAEFRRRGVEPIFYTAAPASVLEQWLPDPAIVPWHLDVGLAQPDSLRIDLDRTRALLDERCSEQAVDRLAAHLGKQALLGVVADLPPTGLEAARRAGLPTIAVGNFDWAWVYEHFDDLAPWAERFRVWQAPHTALQLWPGPPLSGFARVLPGPLVGRRCKAYVFPDPDRHVLVSFGGFGLDDLDRRLPRLDGVRWVLSAPMPALERDDCTWLEGVPYPALVAGAEAVLTKPGYGILAEALVAGTPLAWFPRADWPESPFLAEVMAGRGDVRVDGSVAEALETLWSRPRPAPHDPSGASVAAHRILAELFQAVGLEGPEPLDLGVPDPVT